MANQHHDPYGAENYADQQAGAVTEPDIDKFNQMTPQNHDPGMWGDGMEDGNPAAKTLFIILGVLCVLTMVVAVVTLLL